VVDLDLDLDLDLVLIMNWKVEDNELIGVPRLGSMHRSRSSQYARLIKSLCPMRSDWSEVALP